MTSTSRKRARLHLRSRGRDDVLHQLFGELRNQENQFRCDLKQLHAELEAEQNYVSKLKKERDAARTQLAESAKELDQYKNDHEKEMSRLNALLADAQRIKNMERMSRDGIIRKQTLACTQRKIERLIRTTNLEYQKVFQGSGLEFDPEVESSDEEPDAPPHIAIAPPEVEKLGPENNSCLHA